jgi:hypothetical protein
LQNVVSSHQFVQCVTTQSGCPTPPDPRIQQQTPNYDVDNDGDVDTDDVAAIALIGGCDASSCANPVTFNECTQPSQSFLVKQLYATPSGGGSEPVDCVASTVQQCGGIQCAWCTAP